ncbi:MAG TPA: hypothetical protein VG167_18995 [Verrucomicrobiae bacterium]|nr:hypothetical protein [Verrucomicrobiae bacterium]
MSAQALQDSRVRDTAAVLLADGASFAARHATEIKAAEDFVIFILTVGFLLWKWRRDARSKDR